MNNCKKTLSVNGKDYSYYSLKALSEELGVDLSNKPYSMKVLLENLLRNLDGNVVTEQDIKNLASWTGAKNPKVDINYHPARVVMQDFTGVPAVVDLAAMRDAIKSVDANPEKINPQVPVDLVIDHSVMVDHFASEEAFGKNVQVEFERNAERYKFLKWGQNAFQNFRVVPPGTGIIHQVNVEYLAQTIWTKEENGETIAYPDTCVGTDSHTTMVNGISVLGWGVGGIEAEAAMLGQAVTMLTPDVVGFKLNGKLTDGTTATDLVLRVVEMLREKGVVGKFVEFYGPGLDELSLADMATIANMAPEYGATCGFFPINQKTIDYLTFTGREPSQVAMVEAYAKEQGMWRDANTADPDFTDTLELDMGSVVPAIAGPKRPQDRINLSDAKSAFANLLDDLYKINEKREVQVEGSDYAIEDGDVVISAITSCTNTSNPSVLIAAGLVARKARELGITRKPWVKTSLAPGSQVVTEYLVESGLQEDLDALGYNLVGYGCTTCIGNSGPLPAPISKAINEGDLVACSVLSGNRNFEGRVSPDCKANYLASPPLCVAYAIAGSMKIDITKDVIAKDKDGNDVYLKDIWPSNSEIENVLKTALTPEMFKSRYANVFKGTDEWQAVQTSTGQTYEWDSSSTYIKNPPFFEGFGPSIPELSDIKGARPLAILGDSVTTDHISPAGSIKSDGPAGKYLSDRGVAIQDFNSFGSRRGNDDVMARGTFANIRIKNEMVPGTEGGYTKHIPTGEEMSIYDAAVKYKSENTPLVVFGGKEYGTGSSRDWAAKGTLLLGVKAVVTESYERIHRSNLIGMGVLPLEFMNGESRKSLGLTGNETFDIEGVTSFRPGGELTLTIHKEDGTKTETKLKVRIDTQNEYEYYRNGGILTYVMRNLAK